MVTDSSMNVIKCERAFLSARCHLEHSQMFVLESLTRYNYGGIKLINGPNGRENLADLRDLVYGPPETDLWTLTEFTDPG